MERDAGHGIVFSLLQIQWPTTVFLSFAVMLSWCFLPFFHHICASTFRDENSEKKKNKSTDLAGGEFVIILFNGIDFLFIFTAEGKGRIVNKRIMLLSL